MSFPQPPRSKSSVRKAGEAIANGNPSTQDFQLVEQWRASHGYVINTFQGWLKRRIKLKNENIEFAQRLKRSRTVIDKLRRRDSGGNPLISDVSSMHDLAGCRLIFNNLEELITFRNYMHSLPVTRNVKHELRHEKDKYNYIECPKLSGYRGIHDVYKHFPRGSERREEKKLWDGLLVEVQYRTRAQHAWATAVEISDLLDGEKTKFELDQSERGKFFAIASEIIARKHENLTRAFLDTPTNLLQEELRSIEDKLGILNRLALLKQFEVEGDLRKHSVLNIYRSASGELRLSVKAFRTATLAIEGAKTLEERETSVNTVYVRSDNPKQLRSAYRNYFNDPIDFVKILQAEGEL